MSERDATLCEQIKSLMFVFDDLVSAIVEQKVTGGLEVDHDVAPVRVDAERFETALAEWLDKNLPPHNAHLFGTDDLGRDVLSRIIYGARASLLVGICAVGLGALVGGILGMLAAPVVSIVLTPCASARKNVPSRL